MFSTLQKLIQYAEGSTAANIPGPPEVYGSFFGFNFSFFSDTGFLSTIAEFFASFWNIYSIIAYILSIIFLIIYVYATLRWNEYLALEMQQLRDEEALYDEYYRGVKKNSRLEEVYIHSQSESPNDWRLAIIEADIILDGILKERGYAGSSLGERLRSITPSQLSTIDDAWEAHKVRNQIAHDGADFILTQRLAEETVNRYRRVFTEFGIS